MAISSSLHVRLLKKRTMLVQNSHAQSQVSIQPELYQSICIVQEQDETTDVGDETCAHHRRMRLILQHHLTTTAVAIRKALGLPNDETDIRTDSSMGKAMHCRDSPWM